MNNSMDILEAAISHEGSIANLADSLGINPSAISMWRLRRNLSAAWRIVLTKKYGKHLRNAAKAALISPVIGGGA